MVIRGMAPCATRDRCRLHLVGVSKPTRMEARPESNPVAIDFRAGSQLFASARTLKPTEFLIG